MTYAADQARRDDRADEKTGVVAGHHEADGGGREALGLGAHAEQRGLQSGAEHQHAHAEQKRPSAGDETGRHGSVRRVLACSTRGLTLYGVTDDKRETESARCCGVRWAAAHSTVLAAAALCLITLVGLAAPSQAASRAAEVQLVGERLIGRQSPIAGINAFLGVPFAEPPVGPLRWQAPVDYLGRGGVRRAERFAPACLQTPRILDWYRGMAERFGASRSVFEDLDTSEDCLYLNIWAPAKPSKKPAPVMVFIHGGSNRSGWSFEPNYHGHRLAAEGAVVVTIAYRLGVFGFFSHPELAQQSVTANFGLWDQLSALRWIQRNIASFGGDPSRVTVFGESAGAGNIAMLMVAPQARGLLHRAILQSGGDFGWPGLRSLAAEQARGLQLAAAIDAKAPPDLAALRAMDAERLMRLAEQVFRDHYHAPVMDGVLITQSIAQQLAPAQPLSPAPQLTQPRVPLGSLLIGTNANEYYAPLARDTARAAFDRALASAEVLNTAEVRAALRDEADLATAIDRLQTADSMLCPAQQLASATAAVGIPTWMYQFSRVREGAVAAQLRAYHGAELPYVFGTHDAWLPTTDIDRQLTRTLMRIWVKFAATGSPEGAGLPRWPQFRSQVAPNVMGFAATPGLIDIPEPTLCRLYRSRVAASASQ
ncbi:MAG: carboxylesterase family protein [Sinobacteraceae bacterium]|nr:carboxylesterase family protein [Nevskiaceae bacterium]